MDIMFLVVLSTIFLGFQPLTAVMIVIMSLLDDVPIMTIAYDNTPVAEKPIRWQMARLLSVAGVLGLFSVTQSFGLLLIGMEVLSSPGAQQSFGLADHSHLQSLMFLQLVAGGHLLLFVTRTERWFFLPPYPAGPLFSAIVATQVLAVVMCAFGILVPQLSWTLIGLVWVYNLAWMFLLGAVRLGTEALLDHRTQRRLRSRDIVNQPLLSGHADGEIQGGTAGR